MNKKVIAISLVALFTLVTFFPTVFAEDEYKQTGIFTDLSSYLRVDWNQSDINEPIIPQGEMRSVNISIKYGVTSGGLFKLLTDLMFAFQKGKQVNINLEIVDSSEWCNASLLQHTLTTSVSDEEQELNTKLLIKVDKDAPAYEHGFVTINVSTDPIKGLFGIITKIEGYQQQFTIKFRPAYLPLIKTELPSGNQIEISPYNQTTIPIDISNLGNARTTVIAEIVNVSEKWNVTITDNIVLDSGEKNQIYLTVKTDHRFDEELIKIKLTPARSENISDIGESIYETIIFINDGSYKEEQGFEIDTTLLLAIIAIIIIIIILLIVIILLKKRRI